MTLAALLALALLTQPAQPAEAAPASAAADAPAAAQPTEGPVPPGAPEDDYGLVAWCQGALAGHMELYAQVKPTLDAVNKDPRVANAAAAGARNDELDQQQMAAGREYLALYQRALDAAEKANPRALGRQRQAAQAKGASIWQPAANAVDPKTTMWSWLMWELPGRCETAAKRLADRSELLAPALRGAE